MVINEGAKKRVIRFDFFLQHKKYFLYVAFALTVGALTWTVLGFLGHLFSGGRWWLALLALPLVIVSFLFTNFPRLASRSKRHRILQWFVLIANIIATLLIITVSVPQVNDAWALVCGVLD